MQLSDTTSAHFRELNSCMLLLPKQRMPHSSHLVQPFPTSSRPAATYERGRDLCTFVSTAASNVIRTLQRPCRNRPNKRKVNHRRFLQNQICKSFSDIEAATHRLASSILSQKAEAPPAASQAKHLPQPHTALASAGSSFSGIAEAFVAPDPSPGWPLSLDSLTADPDALFEPITKEMGLTTNPWPSFSSASLRSSLAPCDRPWSPQPHGGPLVSVDPNISPPFTTQCPSPVSTADGFMVPAHNTDIPFWDLDMW